MKIKHLLVLCIISLFQSCATPALYKGQIRFDKTYQIGLLVGSVTFPTTEPHYSGYFFRLTNNTSQEFEIDRNEPGQLDSGRTYIVILERPAGKAEIPSIRIFHNYGFAAGQFDTRIGGFSVPYEIRKGEITYFGNISYDDYAKKGDTAVTYKYNYEKDIEALKNIQPSIDWTALNHDSIPFEYTDKKARL